MVFYICMRFHEISQTVFNLQSGHEYMVEMAIFNVQRAITPKVGQTRVMVHVFCTSSYNPYICVKFRENITNSIRVMEWTRVHGRNGYVQSSKDNNFKSRQTRVVANVTRCFTFCLKFGNKNSAEGVIAPAGAKVTGATIRMWLLNKFISFLAVLTWKTGLKKM